MVPCNCAECRAAHRPHFFRHELFERYLRRGCYDITCEVSLEDVDMRSLLREAIPFEQTGEDCDRYYVYSDLYRGDRVGGDRVGADKIGGHKAGRDLIDVGDISDANGIVIGKDNEL